MEFKIDTYRPKYLSQQVKLGEEIRKNWPLGKQVPFDQLQKKYNSSDFDESTNYYAVADDEVIGFVTASVSKSEAEINFPIVRDNDGEIGRQLLDHTIQDMKDRGVTTITAKASPLWGKTEVFAIGFGFEPGDIQIAQGRRLVRLLPSIEMDNTTSLTLPDDTDRIRSIMEDQLGYPSRYVDQQLNILDQEDLVLSWRCNQVDDQVISHGVVVNDPIGSDIAYLFHLYLDTNFPKEAEDFVKTVLADLEHTTIEYINVVLSQKQTEFMELFESLGFSFAKIINYHKKLE